MTLLLWFCSLVALGLLLAAWREGRDAAPDRCWSYPVQPQVPQAPLDERAQVRANARPALQTGVCILAVALALDVSGLQQPWSMPLEPEGASSSAAASGLLDFSDAAYPGSGAYSPASWSMSATATDGWFV